jgi:hypothetical protein
MEERYWIKSDGKVLATYRQRGNFVMVQDRAFGRSIE